MKTVQSIRLLYISYVQNNKTGAYSKYLFYYKLQILQGSSDNGVPIGTAIIWTTADWQQDIKATGGRPDHWLECNGQTVDNSKYPKLAKIMRHTPNYVGIFLRGRGGNAAPIGQIQGDAIRNIWGSFNGNVDDHNLFYGAFYDANRHVIGSNGNDESGPGGYISFNASLVVPTAEENRPVNTAVVFLIKAK